MYRDRKGTPAVIVKRHGQGTTVYLNAVLTDYHLRRVHPAKGESLRLFMAALLKNAGVSRQAAITQTSGQSPTGVEVHPWRCGNLQVLGIHRNYGLMVSELGPADYKEQTALTRPLELKIDFEKEVALYDTRQGTYLGMKKLYQFPLDQIQPTILAVLPLPVKDMMILAPREASPGTLMEVKIILNGPKLGDTHAFRAKLLDPKGRELSILTRNLAAPQGKTIWELPLAADLPQGEYTLQVKDAATGVRSEHRFNVR